MLTAFLTAISPFALNGVMSISKWAVAQNWGTPGKRTILAILALLGVFAGNALNGTPIDAGSVSGLVTLVLESFAAFIAAHGSYTLFWKSA